MHGLTARHRALLSLFLVATTLTISSRANPQEQQTGKGFGDDLQA
jgi:hypothetical protein